MRQSKLRQHLKSFPHDGPLSDELRVVLEAARYREQNLAIKGSATLGFCGLMIASILVQMSAPPESMIFVSVDSPWSFFARWGLILLLVSAFLSLVAITGGRAKFSTDSESAIGEMIKSVYEKRTMRVLGSVLCIAGSGCAALCLLGPLLAVGSAVDWPFY